MMKPIQRLRKLCSVYCYIFTDQESWLLKKGNGTLRGLLNNSFEEIFNVSHHYIKVSGKLKFSLKIANH